MDASPNSLAATVVAWLSLLVGGLTFGVGMTLSGGCANKNLVRMGGGSLRSVVVRAFLAIASYMTLKGLFGQWRAVWLDPVAINLAELGWKDQSLATAVARATGLAPATALLATAITIAAAGGGRVQRQALSRQRKSSGWGRDHRLAHRGGLVRERASRLRREPRDARRKLLRHQLAHARIHELRRAGGLQPRAAAHVDRQIAPRDPRAACHHQSFPISSRPSPLHSIAVSARTRGSSVPDCGTLFI